jgi:hypothetical protein
MSGFEFVFSLFGLLLGFSLVEVLGGFAKAMEARFRSNGDQAEPTRLGWLTPLLGIYVMLDVTSFWAAAWIARDQLSAVLPVLFAGLLFGGSYYLAAHAVFPSEPQRHADLDDHYFRVRRWVFGILSTLLVIQIIYWLSVPQLAERISDPFEFARDVVLSLALMIAAIVVKGRVASIVLLSAMIASYLYDYVGHDLLTAAGVLS